MAMIHNGILPGNRLARRESFRGIAAHIVALNFGLCQSEKRFVRRAPHRESCTCCWALVGRQASDESRCPPTGRSGLLIADIPRSWGSIVAGILDLRHRTSIVRGMGIPIHALRGGMPVPSRQSRSRRAELHQGALPDDYETKIPRPPAETQGRNSRRADPARSCLCPYPARAESIRPVARLRVCAPSGRQGPIWLLCTEHDLEGGQGGQDSGAPQARPKSHCVESRRPAGGSGRGWGCPMKRGKPAPGQKASRVLRRQKRKWRAKSHAS